MVPLDQLLQQTKCRHKEETKMEKKGFSFRGFLSGVFF
jgi:hypothetical protein